MWVWTTAGFVSAVEHRQNHDNVMVRARDRESLENMLTSIELAGKALAEDGSEVTVDKDLVIKTSSKGDYRHRVTCSKSTFALFLQFEVLNYLSYPNFKSELAKFRGADFTSAAHSVWSVMHKVSDGDQVYGTVGKGGTRLLPKHTPGQGKWLGSTFFEGEDGGVEGVDPDGVLDEDWNSGYHTFGGSEDESFLTEPTYKDQFEEAEREFSVLPDGSENWTDEEWEAYVETLGSTHREATPGTFLEPVIAKTAKTEKPEPEPTGPSKDESPVVTATPKVLAAAAAKKAKQK